MRVRIGKEGLVIEPESVTESDWLETKLGLKDDGDAAVIVMRHKPPYYAGGERRPCVIAEKFNREIGPCVVTVEVDGAIFDHGELAHLY